MTYFASLLLHELGHAVQARREQMEIDGITLWLFGGVAAFRGEFPSALAELRIALAGPLVTAVLSRRASRVLLRLGLPETVDGVVTWLAVINLVAARVQHPPGAAARRRARAPRSALALDGRSPLRDERRGRGRSRVRVRDDRGGLGLVVAGAGAGGIWFAFLGWFLLQAATAEQRELVLRDALGDLRVDDLMVHRPVTAPAERALSEFMDEVAHVHRFTTYPVVDAGHVVGLLPFARVAATPRAGWDEHHVRDCMILLDEAAVVQPGTPLLEALHGDAAQGETARSCSTTATSRGCSRSPT